MPETMEELCGNLAGMPVRQRAELAHFLIQSLDDECDEDAESAWDEELARRLAKIERGEAVTVPAEEVFARLSKKYG